MYSEQVFPFRQSRQSGNSHPAHAMKISRVACCRLLIATNAFWIWVIYVHLFKSVGGESNAAKTRSRYTTFARSNSSFHEIASHYGTDKVNPHHYHWAYDKYLTPIRHSRVKFLEIGLGCDMAYGAGRSAQVWKTFFSSPQTEIWQADVDSGCVQKWSNMLGDRVLVGDQGNLTTLKKWVSDTGGNFDIVIDDGGHSFVQQLNSFLYLFQNAVRPGGMYFIEDLVSSRPELRSYFADGPKSTVTKILKWQETLMLEDLPATGKFDIQGLQSIECFRGMCAFFKCSLDQYDCP